MSSSEDLERKNENHDDFSKNLPDLIVIDGGRNQMNVASTVLKKYKITIPILAIAKGEKRNEGREDFYFQDRIFNFPTSSSLLFFFKEFVMKSIGSLSERIGRKDLRVSTKVSLMKFMG